MQTQTIASFKNPAGPPLKIIKQTFTAYKPKATRRISFIGGLHGDELEGVYLCAQLIRLLQGLQETEPEAFLGDIHIYPASNPQSIANGSRLWPFYSVDINRTMGKEEPDSLPDKFAKCLLNDIVNSSDYAVDFHGSNLQLHEVPQIRITEEYSRKLLPLAALSNVDLIWVHPSASVFESTLGYNLNIRKVQTLVIETGICHRIHQEYCDQICLGMLNFMQHLKILNLANPPKNIQTPRLAKPADVTLIASNHAGLFTSHLDRPGQRVQPNEKLGEIIDPVNGSILEEIIAPSAGFLFTLRKYPLVYPGAPLARIAMENEE